MTWLRDGGTFNIHGSTNFSKNVAVKELLISLNNWPWAITKWVVLEGHTV